MEDAAAVVRRLFAAMNAHDADLAAAVLHPDFTRIGPDGQLSATGPKEMAALLDMYFVAFPDFDDQIRHLHRSGDSTVVTEVMVEGTHLGDMAGLAPTGRRIALPACIVWEVRDGLVFAEREYADFAFLMQQLGVGAGA